MPIKKAPHKTVLSVRIITAPQPAPKAESVDVDWSVAEWVIEQPRVDEALRNFADDQTASNAAGLAQAILETASCGECSAESKE